MAWNISRTEKASRLDWVILAICALILTGMSLVIFSPNIATYVVYNPGTTTGGLDPYQSGICYSDPQAIEDAGLSYQSEFSTDLLSCYGAAAWTEFCPDGAAQGDPSCIGRTDIPEDFEDYAAIIEEEESSSGGGKGGRFTPTWMETGGPLQLGSGGEEGGGPGTCISGSTAEYSGQGGGNMSDCLSNGGDWVYEGEPLVGSAEYLANTACLRDSSQCPGREPDDSRSQEEYENELDSAQDEFFKQLCARTPGCDPEDPNYLDFLERAGVLTDARLNQYDNYLDICVRMNVDTRLCNDPSRIFSQCEGFEGALLEGCIQSNQQEFTQDICSQYPEADGCETARCFYDTQGTCTEAEKRAARQLVDLCNTLASQNKESIICNNPGFANNFQETCSDEDNFSDPACANLEKWYVDCFQNGGTQEYCTDEDPVYEAARDTIDDYCAEFPGSCSSGRPDIGGSTGNGALCALNPGSIFCTNPPSTTEGTNSALCQLNPGSTFCTNPPKTEEATRDALCTLNPGSTFCIGQPTEPQNFDPLNSALCALNPGSSFCINPPKDQESSNDALCALNPGSTFCTPAAPETPTETSDALCRLNPGSIFCAGNSPTDPGFDPLNSALCALNPGSTFCTNPPKDQESSNNALCALNPASTFCTPQAPKDTGETTDALCALNPQSIFCSGTQNTNASQDSVNDALCALNPGSTFCTNPPKDQESSNDALCALNPGSTFCTAQAPKDTGETTDALCALNPQSIFCSGTQSTDVSQGAVNDALCALNPASTFCVNPPKDQESSNDALCSLNPGSIFCTPGAPETPDETTSALCNLNPQSIFCTGEGKVYAVSIAGCIAEYGIERTRSCEAACVQASQGCEELDKGIFAPPAGVEVAPAQPVEIQEIEARDDILGVEIIPGRLGDFTCRGGGQDGQLIGLQTSAEDCFANEGSVQDSVTGLRYTNPEGLCAVAVALPSEQCTVPTPTEEATQNEYLRTTIGDILDDTTGTNLSFYDRCRGAGGSFNTCIDWCFGGLANGLLTADQCGFELNDPQVPPTTTSETPPSQPIRYEIHQPNLGIEFNATQLGSNQAAYRAMLDELRRRGVDLTQFRVNVETPDGKVVIRNITINQLGRTITFGAPPK